MNWTTTLAILLLVFSAGWMLFDGARALITGEYITPQSGEFAGQLGPWSNLVKTVGIDPHSTLMKLIFIFYGLGMLTLITGYAFHQPWARTGLLIAALLGLWYLPIGTLMNLLALIFLLLTRR